MKKNRVRLGRRPLLQKHFTSSKLTLETATKDLNRSSVVRSLDIQSSAASEALLVSSGDRGNLGTTLGAKIKLPLYILAFIVIELL